MRNGNLNFDALTEDEMSSDHGRVTLYNITKLSQLGYKIEKLPYSVRILLENLLRSAGKVEDAQDAIARLASWPKSIGSTIPFMPGRVLIPDYTGVPLVLDLAALRDAAARAGKDPRLVNSAVPVDVVIDHSIQVDRWGDSLALSYNMSREYERNGERYAVFKWLQESFDKVRVVPPGKGICHQVNLEFLSTVVALHHSDGRLIASPDTLIGTDSHTPMVNGLGVLGWGVGGIEAEAVMLGEPYHMPIPRVVGVRLSGCLKEGATTTDLVLTITELLRKRNLTDAFVEYFGDGFLQLSVADRATLGNMAPEYGATVGYSPVDQATLKYLVQTGRDFRNVDLVERYFRRQGLFVTPDSPEPEYSEVVELDMSEVEPSVAGPRNPEERRSLRSIPSFAQNLIAEQTTGRNRQSVPPNTNAVPLGTNALLQEELIGGGIDGLGDGSVIIAAITSCTNTSNPTLMIGAGLLARNAVRRGLSPKSFVKCSLAPGSKVVTDYLKEAGLLPYLDQLGFNVVGYGCTTCIGNSGPLDPSVEKVLREHDLYTVAVLSGNRNFDGRIHPYARGAFLMSPPLVIAYALAGRVGFDFYAEPLGSDGRGIDVYLKDIWPSSDEIKDIAEKAIKRSLFETRYSTILEGDKDWAGLAANQSSTYQWNPSSTYIKQPPWFGKTDRNSTLDIKDARVLALFGDKITTDHISPAGIIPLDSPAGQYLLSEGVNMIDFGTYGTRRGNHEVMVRGGFANPKIKNLLAGGRIGGFTKYLPTNEELSIFDASMKYQSSGVPLIVLAGKQYGTGSSRDWAAKAAKLLGVLAVVAESFERIHRSNLIAMGILPLQFKEGEGVTALGLTGEETFDLVSLGNLSEGRVSVTARPKGAGKATRFEVIARITNRTETQYYLEGGVLPYVKRRVVGA